MIVHVRLQTMGQVDLFEIKSNNNNNNNNNNKKKKKKKKKKNNNNNKQQQQQKLQRQNARSPRYYSFGVS